MNIKELDKGLIYTDSKSCVGCNNCIRECPELTANVTLMEGDGFKTHIDAEACILCGTCIDTCTHEVRCFRDDCNDFFNDLSQGKDIMVLQVEGEHTLYHYLQNAPISQLHAAQTYFPLTPP